MPMLVRKENQGKEELTTSTGFQVTGHESALSLEDSRDSLTPKSIITMGSQLRFSQKAYFSLLDTTEETDMYQLQSLYFKETVSSYAI